MNLKSERKLCLTGTPLQNNLWDLHSLLRFLQVEPWNLKPLWENCIIKQISSGNQMAIQSLQLIMQTLTLRRLKANLLHLPKKVQHGVGIEIYEPWKTLYFKKHEEFSALYGKQRSKAVQWDSSEFFSRLSDLRQLCNHPALIEREEGGRRYTWKEGSKVVHLVSHLKEFFQKEPGLRYPKAVVFSEYKRFLDM